MPEEIVVSEFVPRTADGHVIYPGMSVHLCRPWSNELVTPDIIFGVCGTIGPCAGNDYSCVLQSRRYRTSDNWEDGNPEHVSNLFFSRDACLEKATATRMASFIGYSGTVFPAEGCALEKEFHGKCVEVVNGQFKLQDEQGNTCLATEAQIRWGSSIKYRPFNELEVKSYSAGWRP